MSEIQEFEEQEFDDEEFEKAEASLFAGEDDTEILESKGMRRDPSFIAIQFRRWFSNRYPSTGGVHNLSHRDIMRYVQQFEYETGIRSGYTAEDWIVVLKQ